MWELLGHCVFLITGRVIIDTAISSSHHPVIKSWMVRNRQLHCRDFENLDFAKYLADSSDSSILDDFKCLNSVRQCFIKIQTFYKIIG